MKNLFITLASSLIAFSVSAKSDVQAFVGFSQVSLDIEEKRGPDFSDDFSTIRFGLGAYRWASEKSSWGFVVEFENASGRDHDIGSGRLIGFRPINWRYMWLDNLSTEVFAGAARYEWEKTAIGYYAGTKLNYTLDDLPIILSAEAKYYHELSYDTANGDIFVSGPSVGMNVSYTF